MTFEEVWLPAAKHRSIIEVVFSFLDHVGDSIFSVETVAFITAILLRFLCHLSLSLVSFLLHFEGCRVDLETTLKASAESWVVLWIDLSFLPALCGLLVDDTKL